MVRKLDQARVESGDPITKLAGRSAAQRQPRRQVSSFACLPAAAAMLCLPLLLCSSGCTWISYLGTDYTGQQNGMTWYVGGAGPFGQVGTIDVPAGLRAGGWEGGIECFGWQAVLGGTLRDQIDRDRNEEQAHRLAKRIRTYMERYPGRPVNIIALSAGTGITTWALESLPDRCRVGTVIFLGSSLSSRYDLTAALRRIDNKLYNFSSREDPVLKYGVQLAGSVDRETEGPNVAGLYGFRPPRSRSEALRDMYKTKVRNVEYREIYAKYGYHGGHTGGTSADFVKVFLTPLLRTRSKPAGELPAMPEPASAPSEEDTAPGEPEPPAPAPVEVAPDMRSGARLPPPEPVPPLAINDRPVIEPSHPAHAVD